MTKRFILFLIVLTLSVESYSGGTRYFYIIKRNELVSNVLYRAKLAPIYGKNGTLQILQIENSENIKDLDKVSPGEKIYFPLSIAKRAQRNGLLQVRADKELFFIGDAQLAKVQKTPQRRVAQEPLAEDREKSFPTEGPVLAPDGRAGQKEDLSPAQSRLIVALGSGYSRIDSNFTATGADAVLLSRPLLSGKLRWEHIWSERYESLINFSFFSVPYQEANQGQVYAGHPSLTSSSFGILRRFETSSFSVETGVSEEIMITSYEMGTATVEIKPLVFFKPVYLKDLLQVRSLKLTAGLGLGYYLGSSFGNYQVDQATKYFGSLQIAQKFNHFSFFASTEYSDGAQKTSITNQRRREIEASFGFVIPIGGSAP